MPMKRQAEVQFCFDCTGMGVYCEGGISHICEVSIRFRSPMSSFGEDLRNERLSRGIALEQITAVTKISRRHLLALEQEKFRLLPGGIISKGIVRGYAGAIGLDEHDWTQRFVQASSASGQASEDRDWTEFASNVGKARIQQRDSIELRVRWLGAFLVLLLVAAGAFLTVRYLGIKAGWWSTLLPQNSVFTALQSLFSSAHTFLGKVHDWFAS